MIIGLARAHINFTRATSGSISSASTAPASSTEIKVIYIIVNLWNDEDSKGGTTITTTELQEAINCRVTIPHTKKEISTSILQGLINDWILS